MASPRKSPLKEPGDRQSAAIVVQPSSPRYPPSGTPTSGAQRRIGIAVDLSDESAFAVKWAVQNYLRPGDVVILLHVRPTSVLYGADWGSTDVSIPEDQESQQKLEDDFDNFTVTKANDLAKPLEETKTPYKIHIVKDHDMKERLCLEVERLGLSAVVMGSRGFGASKTTSKARLGSVSDYCVHHCVCPVIVVRFSDEKDENDVVKQGKFGCPVVREDEPEFHDALEKGIHCTRPVLWEKNFVSIHLCCCAGGIHCISETRFIEVCSARNYRFKNTEQEVDGD